MSMHRTPVGIICAAAASVLAPPALGGGGGGGGGGEVCPLAGTVLSEQKVSATEGGFEGVLAAGDQLGRAIAEIGDVDGDGVADLIVGANRTGDGGPDRGAAWVLFLNADGTVKDQQKISDTAGNFTGGLNDGDRFGTGVAALGDLNGDGTPDIAVGAPRDLGGALWVLLLNPDGTVLSSSKIESAGLSGDVTGNGQFAASLDNLGDFNGDGVVDLVAGVPLGGVGDRGAIWLLFLNADGTLAGDMEITAGVNGFVGPLDVADNFGSGVASLGDVDGDGVTDIGIGAFNDDDGGANRGAAWVLLMNGDGTVKSEQKVSSTEGGLAGPLNNDNRFGAEVASLGDLDGDGTPDMAVTADLDDAGGLVNAGAVWVLFLESDGTVRGEQKIGSGVGGFVGPLSADDRFGSGLSLISDITGDGRPDFAVGAIGEDDGAVSAGGLWLLSLDTGGNTDCPGDVEPDGVVNSADLNVLLGSFGQATTPGCRPDIDGSGFIDSADLNLLLGAFGQACD